MTHCSYNARITDSRFSVDWFRYGGNRPEAEKRMSTRRARPIRPGRAYPCRSWGSPRAVSITLQPTSGGARFNRASNILQRGNILPNPLRPRHRCRPPLAIEIIGAGAAATSEILAELRTLASAAQHLLIVGLDPFKRQRLPALAAAQLDRLRVFARQRCIARSTAVYCARVGVQSLGASTGSKSALMKTRTVKAARSSLLLT